MLSVEIQADKYTFEKYIDNMEAPIVTLTTDWGCKDFFVAKVKGRLYSEIPGVRVVDLSHQQAWNDLATAANVVRHGCMSFPVGSVHIVDIGSDVTSPDASMASGERQSLLASYRGHYLVCSSRKLLEVSLDSECDELVALPFPDAVRSLSFLAYDQYCDVVKALLSGAGVAEIGQPCAPLRRRSFLQAQIDGNQLDTMVVYLDSYGNVDLNISYEEFEAIRAGRRFKVELDRCIGCSERYEDVTTISRHYSDVQLGGLLLTVSSTGYLQLAVNKDSASRLLGLSYTSKCRFTFVG